MVERVDSRQLEVNRRNLLKTLGLSAAAAGAGVASTPGAAEAAALVGPAMRRERKPARPTPALPATPPLPVIVLNRMGFGPRPGDRAAFNALGSTPQERLEVYVAQQLDPSSIDDSDLEAKIASANYDSVDLSSNPDIYLQTLWAWYINDDGAPDGRDSSWIPREELVRATFMRAMYSKRQLLEVLTSFWHDHFNVYADRSSWVQATLPHLDLQLRTHALGNFRTMLQKVARSPAMLHYLDNYTSSNGGPNENYSRELFELHTMGAENYFGVMPQSQVPTDSTGRPLGYVDADVFETTRCFTGWSFSFGSEGDGDTGLFYYRSSWHDRFQKYVLGNFLSADQTDLKDGKDVLDFLASHPGTGRYIARKLCRKFIADDPPQSVVDAAAAVFTDQWQAADQLEQVMRTILLSEEFKTTWGEKIKRPFEIAVSAFRAANSQFILRMDHSDTSSFLWRYSGTGHWPFGWPAPDGYPDVRTAWKSMTPRVMSWRMCAWLVDFYNDNDQPYLNIVGRTPDSARSANELADFWIDRILNRPMESAERQEIVDFMAQGFNPDFDLDFSDEDTLDRLRSMVGLILMSPDFLWR
ncbi:MAG: DUF1800 domain-containing protein [Thermoanaerobaculia bacterium]|jgi:uncharacterized protein (DUF1800 family)